MGKRISFLLSKSRILTYFFQFQFQLPDEIWVNCLLKLDLKSLLLTRQVSRTMNSFVLKTFHCQQYLNLVKTISNWQLKQIFQQPFQWSSLYAVKLSLESSKCLELLTTGLAVPLQQFSVHCENIESLSLQNFSTFHNRMTELSIKWHNGTIFTSGK